MQRAALHNGFKLTVRMGYIFMVRGVIDPAFESEAPGFNP
jgi:hypothetical protein